MDRELKRWYDMESVAYRVLVHATIPASLKNDTDETLFATFLRKNKHVQRYILMDRRIVHTVSDRRVMFLC